MANRVSVSSVNTEEVTLELYNANSLVKQVRKTHASISAFHGLVTRWHKETKFPSVASPIGWFAPPIHVIKEELQKFFDSVMKAVPDSFAVKFFFRLYDLKGKVVILSGASSGIGKQNAYQLAEMGAHLILACRSEAKTLPILEEIKAKTKNDKVEFMHLDLMSLKSISSFVEAFKARNLPLHILINNAAAVLDGSTDLKIDGTFAVNQVGPFLLTMGLLDILKKTENSRIIYLASMLAFYAKGLPLDKIKAGIPLSYFKPTEAYSYSKLANILTVKLLAKKLAAEEGVSTRVYALHPGIVATDIWRAFPAPISALIKKFMLEEEEGSFETMYCALGEGVLPYSGYYYDYYQGPSPANPQVPEGEDEALQKLCWEETSKMCGLTSSN